MKRFLALLVLSGSLFAQNPETAVFPGAVATDTDLLVVKDDSYSTLNGGIDDSTLTVVVAAGANFRYPSVVKIGSEFLKVCSITTNTMTICTSGRGFAGSTAAAHLTGVTVEDVATAKHHNLTTAEIKAIETALGASLANVTKSTLDETSKPAAPDANKLKVYAKDISGATYFCAENSDAEEICFSPAGIQNDSTSPTSIEYLWQTGTLAAGASGKTNTGVNASGVPVWRANGGAEKTAMATDGNTSGTAAALSATLTEAREPAHDGDVTNSAGDLTLALAVKYRTGIKSIALFDPVAGDSGRVQLMFPTAVTLTRIACATKTSTSTVTLNFEKRAAATPDTSGTAVLSADLVADTNQQTACASGCDVNTIVSAGVAARIPLALTISAVANVPTDLRCHLEYSVD
jgi:hypothetical protein